MIDTFNSQGTVRELEAEISRLEKEKADLSVALNTAKTANADRYRGVLSMNRNKNEISLTNI